MFLNIFILRVPMNPDREETMRNGMGRLTRREAAVAIAGMSVLPELFAFGQPASAPEKRTSLHQEITLEAEPQRIFQMLMDAKLFAAFTGMPATIDPNPGGAFSTFGGLVEGRNIEILPAKRVVQAWRPSSWEPGTYSIVHFELTRDGMRTMLVLDHTGFPEGDFDHLDHGWHIRYWDPMKKFLADRGQ